MKSEGKTRGWLRLFKLDYVLWKIAPLIQQEIFDCFLSLVIWGESAPQICASAFWIIFLISNYDMKLFMCCSMSIQ